MAWDGSGNFTRTDGTRTGTQTWQDARDAGVKIRADDHDTHDQDLADGIGACITQNNESKPTADFLPNTDATYDLGSATKQWAELHLSGAATIGGAATITGAATVTGATTLNGDFDITSTVGGAAVTDGEVLAVQPGGGGLVGWAPQGHISGLTLSNGTDTDHDIDIATGEATDSGADYVMKLTSGLTKQIDVTWAAGTNAGGDFVTSGSPTADTWYHVFLIRKDSDGTIDAGFDTSVTCANIPTGYTAYRRIGSVLTDGSSNITAFNAYEVEGGALRVMWDSYIIDINDTAPGTSANLGTLSGPPGSVVFTTLQITDGAATSYGIFSETDQSDVAPGSGTYTHVVSPSTMRFNSQMWSIRVDANSQIRYRVSATSTDVAALTQGYQDSRR